MDAQKMKIIFEGEKHQIDADTLIVALEHYQSIMEVANRELGSEKKIELKVNAIKKGSFEIVVSVVESTIKTLFSGQNIEYLSGIVTIVGGIYGSYRALKGKKVKTEEDKKQIQKIVNTHNTTININQIINAYNQPKARIAVSKTIEAANQDVNVEGFTIKDETTNAEVNIPREDFKELIRNDFNEEEEIPSEKIETKKARLTIISLSFESGNAWQFMYEGFKISVKVKDNALMNIIDNGARFGKGDTIEVELEIIKRFNPDYGSYENKSYRILEFYQHIPVAKTQQMFEQNGKS